MLSDTSRSSVKLPVLSLPPDVPSPISSLALTGKPHYILPPPVTKNKRPVSSNLLPYTLSASPETRESSPKESQDSGVSTTPETEVTAPSEIKREKPETGGEKRKRGRPRKFPVATADPPTEKRKRGRPKLPPLEEREKSKYIKKKKPDQKDPKKEDKPIPELLSTTTKHGNLSLTNVSTSMAENPNAESPCTATTILCFSAVSLAVTAYASPTPIVPLVPASSLCLGSLINRLCLERSIVRAPSATIVAVAGTLRSTAANAWLWLGIRSGFCTLSRCCSTFSLCETTCLSSAGRFGNLWAFNSSSRALIVVSTWP
ncbi:hypothetical protein OGAPHI_006254 [Ogataea philodendri]|uniref:Uncharacterized protein n=1 Tax=Ogataea philodendri TaxID=1378263 RepID=A0A9P8T0T1_9ASCO|nr:uncharacterized protein OGAPHI_006254 [Ogataea philodendri]KAH3662073.1 hypothetical protein OGAPHI_006254 [Ogataea philodendri]